MCVVMLAVSIWSATETLMGATGTQLSYETKKLPAAFVSASRLPFSRSTRCTVPPASGVDCAFTSYTVPARVNCVDAGPEPPWQTRQGCPGRCSGPGGTLGDSPP